MRQLFLGLALLLAAVPPAVAADAATPLERTLWAWVAIDATGTVTAIEHDPGQNPAVAKAAGELLQPLHFAPATVAGAPVASAVPVEMALRFLPTSAGDYTTTLVWLQVDEVRNTLAAPPRYPANEIQRGVGGWVLIGGVVTGDAGLDMATFEVLDQGAFDGRRLLVASRSEPFVAATRQVVPSWRFRTAQIDGQPLSVRITMPTTFFPPGHRGARDLPAAAEAARKPQAEPGLLRADVRLPMPPAGLAKPETADRDDVEVTGTRVRRTGG
jgi:hypothetical protein